MSTPLIKALAVAVAAIGAATLPVAAAHAQEAGPAPKHDLCSERPGLTTPECVIEPGHVQLETGLADWTLDKHDGEREDTVLFGQSLARIGLIKGVEARLGWTPYGIDRDRQDGAVTHERGIGDVSVGLKANLRDASDHGDKGVSVALISFATLPAGHDAIGAGTWGAGLLMPLGYVVSKRFEVALTPEVDARPDDDGQGRHLRYSLAAGTAYHLDDAVTVQAEALALRDDDPDPARRGTQTFASTSLAVQPNDRTQFDIGGIAGLNHAAPDLELYAGITRWF